MQRTYILAGLLIVMVVSSQAQLFTDQGVFSGSGLSIVPTATVVPPAEFRLQYTRLSHLQSGANGVNVIGLGFGLSSSVEAYIRVTGEQVGAISSQVAYSFGGKFRLPMMVPFVRRVALWLESTDSDLLPYPTLYPTDAVRSAFIATFDSNGIHPSLMLGVAKMNGVTNSLIGAGVTVATSHTTQAGFEIVHGYLNPNSLQFVASGSARIISNISMSVSAGYISTSPLKSWMISCGVSCSTADIDFHPVIAVEQGEEFHLPSFEDIQKQSNEEKKDE